MSERLEGVWGASVEASGSDHSCGSGAGDWWTPASRHFLPCDRGDGDNDDDDDDDFNCLYYVLDTFCLSICLSELLNIQEPNSCLK